MNKIIVNITDDLTKIPNVDELLPKEFETAGKLREAGTLESLFVKDDRTGAILVLNGVDVEKAKEIIATFPLSKYFDKVEYFSTDKAW